MIKDDVFYTRTMAKVFADQGNLKKAAEIYKYLLECEPGRQDLKAALSNIEKKRFEKSPDNLEKLLGRWVDLLLTHNTMQKLKNLKNYLRDERCVRKKNQKVMTRL